MFYKSVGKESAEENRNCQVFDDSKRDAYAARFILTRNEIVPTTSTLCLVTLFTHQLWKIRTSLN